MTTTTTPTYDALNETGWCPTPPIQKHASTVNVVTYVISIAEITFTH